MSSNGSKTFCVFCRRKGGTPERVTIGAYPRISVDRARQLAKRHLADLGEGISVTVRRRDADIATKTLETVHKEYLTSRGVTVEIVVGRDGKSIERPVVGPASKLKALTARDYVKAIDKKFAD